MTGKLPDWDDDAALVEWTKRMLVAMDEPQSEDDFWRLAQTDEPPLKLSMRGARVREAAQSIRKKELDSFVRLDKEEQKLVMEELARKRPRGRRNGDERPSDLPHILRAAYEEALADAKRIRALWLHFYGRQNRKIWQTNARKIAADLYGVKEDQLNNFRKNRRSSGAKRRRL